MYAMEDQGLIDAFVKLKGGTTKPKIERYVALTDSNMPMDSLSDSRKKIIEMIKAQGEISVKKLKAMVPSASKLIKHLEADGYISIFNKRVYRDPFGETINPDIPHNLTQEQTTCGLNRNGISGSKIFNLPFNRRDRKRQDRSLHAACGKGH